MASTRNVRSPEEKSKVIAYARLHGSGEASRLYDIPSSTIRDWVHPRALRGESPAKRPVRTYSDDVRHDALQRLKQKGVTVVSRDMDIPLSTLKEWMAAVSLQTIKKKSSRNAFIPDAIRADQTAVCPPCHWSIERAEVWTCQKCGTQKIVRQPDILSSFVHHDHGFTYGKKVAVS